MVQFGKIELNQEVLNLQLNIKLKKSFYIIIFLAVSILIFYFLNTSENERVKSSLPDYGEGYSDHGY